MDRFRLRRLIGRAQGPLDHHPDASTAEETCISRECEQFLHGQLLECFTEERESLPEWVWINVLAHAPEEYLAVVASRGEETQASCRCTWDRTIAFLAGILLDNAGRTGKPVAQLQRDIVEPIELKVQSRPIAPSTLVRLVLSAVGA